MSPARSKRHALKDSLTPRELAAELATVERLRAELDAQQRDIKSHVRALARGLASVMHDGDCHHRIGLALWAFRVDGEVCLALIDMDDDPGWLERDEEPRYRLAVLAGGLPAVRHLRRAALPSMVTSKPATRRRVGFASYAECVDFLYRLPRYINDVAQGLEDEFVAAGEAESALEDGRLRVNALRELQILRRPPVAKAEPARVRTSAKPRR